ncbi:hypothetical protein KEM52_002578, partial [Ascosphaera acerosa]
MGKPRMIILIRHGHSEGNKNRAIHQTVPDHRVKLTPEGWRQARDAGRKLRALLRPDDTLQFFTSPYRRTRETTEGILDSLTAAEGEGEDEDAIEEEVEAEENTEGQTAGESTSSAGKAKGNGNGNGNGRSSRGHPSPFPRHTIKVFEEPRLREQDFGNFQPGSEEMARIWRERAEYGHFFYRIPNGESAADAYDRVSGFNESLWRQFGDPGFPSVCILVTHGLMSRVFLMKWFHFSVEYFEDLRNINHCEFIVMKLNPRTDKYVLQNKLRTWSELEMETDQKRKTKDLQKEYESIVDSPIPPWRQWCGCKSLDCDHLYRDWRVRRKPERRRTIDLFADDDDAAGADPQQPATASPHADDTQVTDSMGKLSVTDGPSHLGDDDSFVARSQSICLAHLDDANDDSHSSSSAFPSPTLSSPPDPAAAATSSQTATSSRHGATSTAPPRKASGTAPASTAGKLPDRVRRLGRDGGGSTSGVSGMSSSASSSAPSSSAASVRSSDGGSDESSGALADDERDVHAGAASADTDAADAR